MNPNMMNPQFIMAMMNKYGQKNKSQMVFDPIRMSKQEKSYLMKQTIYNSAHGPYEKLPKFKHALGTYCEELQVSEPNHLCEVSVEYDHCLDVAEKYASKGLDYNAMNLTNPVVVNVVGRDFNGSNLEIGEEMRDELINIRTTFSNTFDSTHHFPLKKDECTYLKIVNVIRPSYPHNTQPFIPLNETFRVGMITISPIITQTLLNGKDFLDGKMLANDFISTLTTIECIFQCALWKQHTVLILPPFGNNEEDNNPVGDIIKIYNYCILKYGHMFTKIIIAIPKFYPKDIFQMYKKQIINPIELVVDIDKKYEKEAIKKQIISQQKNTNNSELNISNNPIQQTKIKKSNQSNQSDQQFTPEQIEMFIKMMPSMMNQMQNQN